MALHPEVNGWEALNREYWVNHELEPFKDIWSNPELISQIDWSENEYWVISISSPYVDFCREGTKTFYPKYKEVIAELKEQCQVQVGIIGRDTTIMSMEQLRKRGVKSYHNFLNKIEDITGDNDVVFLSQELLFLYRHEYLKNINNQLIVPIDYNNNKLHYILNEDYNEKFIQYIDQSWLDTRIGPDGKLKDGSLPHDID